MGKHIPFDLMQWLKSGERQKKLEQQSPSTFPAETEHFAIQMGQSRVKH